MAGQRAYSFDLFEPRGDYGTSAPKKQFEEETKPQIARVRAKTRAQKKQEELHVAIRMAAMLFVTAIIFCIVGMQISVGAQRYELIRQIAAMEISVKEATSENKRLNSSLQGMTSISAIDTYATQILGMSKTENYQVEYIDLTTDDAVLFAGNK